VFYARRLQNEAKIAEPSASPSLPATPKPKQNRPKHHPFDLTLFPFNNHTFSPAYPPAKTNPLLLIPLSALRLSACPPTCLNTSSSRWQNTPTWLARLRPDRTFALYHLSHVSVAHKVSHPCIHHPCREHARVDIHLTATSSSSYTSRRNRHLPRCQRLSAPQSVHV
jgi:hypothetical protein